ncbi:hypothetical protein P280DRAFT_250513 [Massarina eburnea CBS 473.64]|uniref:Uncharacterized protein n=1 Tax=Massarina eburnea CBS 473.64 TaxID=1395130 RepID=A0A6A6S6U3_9PLEO|nr:hypothetical protein P280DRAFT_250513 [Massarina eburnea CBS 473.64]
MHFSTWLTEMEEPAYINPSPCRYQLEPAPSPSPVLVAYNSEPALDDHALRGHTWWQSRPWLLTVLTSQDPYGTAARLPPTQMQEALHMLAQRGTRMHNILNLRRGCQRTHGFPQLEWDIFRELAPRFLAGEFKFAQINWHAIGWKDKLRFEEEVDRACAVRNRQITTLIVRLEELEAKFGIRGKEGEQCDSTHGSDEETGGVRLWP